MEQRGRLRLEILQAASAIDQTYISASYIGINTENFSNTATGLFALELRDNDTGLYTKSQKILDFAPSR